MRIILLIIFIFCTNCSSSSEDELLNASYDATRELYKEINLEFVKYYENKYFIKPKIYQSNNASSRQARAVSNGLNAHVVSLSTDYDIDHLTKQSLIDENWRNSFPNQSSPYNTTIVFVVRKDNPKAIKDWDDLVKPETKVITPNPKTSGAAIWNYLAIWNYALNKFSNNDLALSFIYKLYKNVPILDSGARGSSITFTHHNIGDVLITWENEAHLLLKNSSDLQIIYPSSSIKIDLPVAIVDFVCKKKNNCKLAKEYIDFLYSKTAQELIAKNFYRPINSQIFQQFNHQFPQIKWIKIEDKGNWEKIYSKHFSDDGIFDKIYNR